MNKHTVFVAGKRFILLSEDKEEYVQKLASEVSKTINEIAETNPKLESRSCAILCALDYADDKYKEIQRNKSLNQKAKAVIENADKHAKEIKDLKEKINYKNETIAKLQAQVSELEKKVKANTQPKPTEKTEEKAQPKPENKPQEKAEEKPENKPAQQENPQPQKKKKHQHPHENPYKAQAVEKKTEENQNKGYTPIRQISLFENE
ncbi:MAG: cell division protein ZapA [Oscillospiraceae bacterium]|nr:cell division protein ZapA [Oscillospiraceae bacterium]